MRVSALEGASVAGEEMTQKRRDDAEALARVEEAFARCNKARPKREDLAELRRLLDSTPDAWQIAGDLASYAAEKLVGSIQCTPGIRLSVEAGYYRMRERLGYETATEIERGLIEATALAHLRWACAEVAYNVAHACPLTIAQGVYREKLLSAAQCRYLRAAAELARVRRLLRRDPVLQVNVAESGSQVVNWVGERGKKKNMG